VTVTTPAGSGPRHSSDQFNYVPVGLPELGRCEKVKSVILDKHTPYNGGLATQNVRRCAVSKGVQKPEKFESGLTDLLNEGSRPIGQRSLETIADEEKVEIKALP